MTPRRRAQSRIILVLLAAITLSAYWPVLGNGFVGIDDDQYITHNPAVTRGLSWNGAAWALGTFHAGNWHPLTWLSHMIDVTLFGMNASGHHFVGLLLHLVSALLLFTLLERATAALWPSAAAAALFAVHPLHVESVAWASERKDVLSALFWVLTLAAYTQYARRPGPRRFLAVAVSYALGLAAKPMLVSLPFVLLLLDCWPLGRLRRPARAGEAAPAGARPLSGLVLEKFPLCVLAAASAAVTLVAQRRGNAVASWAHVDFGVRAANAAVSYLVYLGKTIWPSGLAVYYPHPESTLQTGLVLSCTAALVALSAAAIRAGRRFPYLPVGWLWYVGTLVPVIGLVQVGAQGHADRYTYVPLVGVFVAAAWGLRDLAAGRRRCATALAVAAVAGVSALVVATVAQAGYWRDSGTLFRHALAVTEDNWLAENDLGVFLADRGRPEEAFAHYERALRLHPDYSHAHFNVGNVLLGAGNAKRAFDHYRTAARLSPRDARFAYGVGQALSALGRRREAEDQFREALRLEPDFPEAHNNLAVSLFAAGRFEEAGSHLAEAVRLDSSNPSAQYNLGIYLLGRGRRDEATTRFREALRLDPGYAAARERLAQLAGGSPAPGR
ncbi:MAG TPA: tetratricopeptide repeat protein [bacterium]